MSTVYASRSRPGRPVEMGAPRAAGDDPRPGFRPDIEGLRALAVILVVLDHAGVPLISGGYVGVDVFFVISGFLITTLLLKEMAPGGTLSIAGFYARRAARLLPASTVVLLATLVGAWFWLPPIRFPSIAVDALTATFYGLNYRLAVEGTDYLNATAAPSPLQHFWSLAVEEQFYLVWPLLLLTVSWAWRGHRTINRLPIGIALVALTVVSLTASVRQTAVSAPWAYFGAHTRAWELAVGALLALVAGGLAQASRPLAAVMTWVGLGGVLVAALTFDETTAFPGYAATLPVAGAALVIAGGCAAPRGGAGLLLDTPPAQLVGKLSYSWYLWHWPILMIAPAALGMAPSLPLNLALAAGALLVAAGSYAWIEEPVRSRRSLRTRPLRGIGLGLSLSGGAAALALFATTVTPALTTTDVGVDTGTRVASAADPARDLARLVAASTSTPSVPANLDPSLVRAAGDKALVASNGCSVNFAGTTPRQCVYGDRTSSTTVVLLGDSHAAHWFPALEKVAETRRWKLVSITKDACPAPAMLVYRNELKRAYTECEQWRTQALDDVATLRPALVVLSSSEAQTASPAERNTDQGWADAWSSTIARLRTSGAKVTVINDTPRPLGNAPECASAHLEDVTACVRDRRSAILHPSRRELVTETAKRAGATVVEPLPWFCTAQKCPPIVGNVLVYRDDSHLTATYARLLAPLLSAALKP